MICKFCEKKKLNQVINFGKFPVCHKFLNKKKKLKNYNLGLSLCKYCNLTQLSSTFPLKELKPIHNWITYNEPEEHLDKLVHTISKLKYINKSSTISGVSYKEISILERFKNKGYKNKWILNPKKDLKIHDTKHNLETIQKKISSIKNFSRIQNLGKSDVLIVRHILEHCYDIKSFLSNLKKLIKKNGYIVFEVPDCEQSFLKRDYVMMWEEHVFYFTKNSFINLLRASGFKVEYFERYKYSYENILIAIVSSDNNCLSFNKKNKLQKNHFNNKNLEEDKFLIKQKIKKLREKNFQICLFGTGHSALTFVNILNIQNQLDIIVDDDKNKFKMVLPGTNLKITNSNNLKNLDKIIILLGVNYESEKKIISKIKKLNKKVKYFSVYKNSKFNLFKNEKFKKN